MRKSIALLAAVLMTMLVSRAATAESVTYGTFGTFSGTGSISNGTVPGGTSSIGVGGSTITFTGLTNLVDTPSHSPLGLFQTTTPLTPGEIDSYNGTTFTLTINQASPAPGVGTVPGTLTGTLRKSTSGAGASNLDLMWSGASVTINGINYAPDDLLIAGATFSAPTTLQGTITAVPVPASVLGGIGLFGLIGLTRFVRRVA